MRAAGVVTGLLVLGTFVIPSPYDSKHEPTVDSTGEAGPTGKAIGPLDEGTGTLAGRVFDEDGTPMAGAVVSLAGSGFWPAKSIETDVDGRFSWSAIPAGVYELRVGKGSLVAPPVEGLILDAGARRSFGMRLAEGWTLRGRIVDAQTGAAVPDAEISVATGALGLHARRGRSDTSGRFELPGVLGARQAVYVDAGGYLLTGPLFQEADAPPMTVRVQRAARIEGLVVDREGRPVRGASVRAYEERTDALPIAPTDSLGVTSGPVPPISAAGGETTPAFARQATTGPDGRFALEGLRPGSVLLRATHDSLAPASVEAAEVRAGETRAGIRIVMEPGSELRGRVIDERGRGLEAIPVELRTRGERLPRMSVTGDGGWFAFQGVRGEVTVSALPYDLSPARTTLALDGDSDETIEIALSSSLYTLRGRVVDARGLGIAGALLTVSSSDTAHPIRRNAKSDEDGTFSVPALPEPPYTLTSEHGAYSRTELGDIDPSDVLEVVMESGVTFLGEVLDDWTGEGLPGADVQVDGPERRSTKSRGDGTFVFRRLPTGTYEVALSHRNYETQNRRIVIEPPGYVDRPQELETVRLVPGGIVEGEVVDADGDLVAGASVTWDDPPRWDRAVRTDARGRFRLPGIPGGSVWLIARHENAGESWTDRAVAVRPLETTPGVLIRLPGTLAY